MMARTQNKLREASAPRNTSPRLQIIREGEPLPEIAARPMHGAPKKRARSPRPLPSSDAKQHCPLCDGPITRFDGDSYSLHGHCAPCHHALT